MNVRDQYRDWEAHRARYKQNLERRKASLKRYRESGKAREAGARYLDRIRADPELYEQHKARWREKAQKSRNKPDNKMRALLKRHSISLEEYRLVVSRQGPGCGICQRTHVKLHLDHCHEDGHMRGLLCNGCNLALGKFGDDIAGLEKALAYIQRTY